MDVMANNATIIIANVNSVFWKILVSELFFPTFSFLLMSFSSLLILQQMPYAVHPLLSMLPIPSFHTDL